MKHSIEHSILVLPNGDVLACGNPYYGRLGLGDMTKYLSDVSPACVIPKPLTKIDLADLKAISSATGYNHSLIVTEDGTLWSCGVNHQYQLGRDLQQDTDHFVGKVEVNNTGFQSCAAGYAFSLGLDFEGRVWGFGSNIAYQLGLIPPMFRFGEPILIPELRNIIQISAGKKHALSLDSNGVLRIAGRDQGTVCQKFVPVSRPQANLTEDLRFEYISCSGLNSAALDVDGNIWTFHEDLTLTHMIKPLLRSKRIFYCYPNLFAETMDGNIDMYRESFQLSWDKLYTFTDVTYIGHTACGIFLSSLHGKIISCGDNSHGQMGLSLRVTQNKESADQFLSTEYTLPQRQSAKSARSVVPTLIE